MNLIYSSRLVVRKLIPVSLMLSTVLLGACSKLQQSASTAPLQPQAQLYLLGEVHDNPAGHQLRLNHIRQIVQQHQSVVLLMEQFDFEQQARLNEAQQRCREVSCLLDYMAQPVTSQSHTGGVVQASARSNWHWPNYHALLQLALDQRIPIVAANLSREQARKLMRADYAEVFSPAQLQRWQLSLGQQGGVHQELHQAQRDEVMQAHCQQVPAQLADGMAKAQIARDILIAESLLQQTGVAVLVAGNGHVRKDRGVPYWLNFAAPQQAGATVSSQPQAATPAQPGGSRKNWLSVGYLETAPASTSYADQIISIPAIARADPCASLSMPGQSTKEKS